jgi:S-DNA-T family DNA segregation ATPase FtsK/SpoIIIE
LGAHFHQPEEHVGLGHILHHPGINLETSFFSYIITGLSDQSVLDGLGHQSIRDAGRQTRNFLGVLGAVVSHIFVYRWFGLGALLLPLVPFIAGWKMAFGREIVPLSKATKEVIFFTLWLSVLMGYIVLMSNTENTLSFLSGGIGYLVNVTLFDWLKWGVYCLSCSLCSCSRCSFMMSGINMNRGRRSMPNRNLYR